MRLAVREGGAIGTALGFFLVVVSLMPLGLGPDLNLLARIAAGILWIALLLAALLSLNRIFEADYEDGTLDVLATGPLPLELVSAAKSLAHWITTGIPLAILAPVLGILLNLDLNAYPVLVATTLIGTPAVSFLGAIGAALTMKTRRGGLLLALIVLPLYVPTLIFGISAVSASAGPCRGRSVVSYSGRYFACHNCSRTGGGRRSTPDPASINGNLRLHCAVSFKGLNPAHADADATPRQPDPLHGAFGARDAVGLGAAAAILLVYGLYLAFFDSPPDYQQGETVRIMYIHVPCAWLVDDDLRPDRAVEFRIARFSPSACGRFGKGCGSSRRRLHVSRACHRLALGQADVGHLLGLGRAPDVRAAPVLPLSRADRAALVSGR